MADGQVTEQIVGTETAVEPKETIETMGDAFETEEQNLEVETGQKEVVEQPTVTQEPSVDWSKYGLSNLSGKSPEEIANFLKYQNRIYGKQQNEIGEMRKKLAEFESKSQMTSPQSTEVKAQMADMDELELAYFAEAFNKNPRSALNKLLKDSILPELMPEIFKQVKEKYDPVIKETSESLAVKNEFVSFTREHPDYRQYEDVMKELMTDAYLGDKFEFNEVYKLAVMADKEQSLFNETCKLMKRGLLFDEAKDYASLRKNAIPSAQAKIDQIKKDVTQAAMGGKRTTTKQAASESKSMTMDDAFGSD
ncbi:MAG: hypothetical protein WC441_04895 [Patescibacteria group bacterium]